MTPTTPTLRPAAAKARRRRRLRSAATAALVSLLAVLALEAFLFGTGAGALSLLDHLPHGLLIGLLACLVYVSRMRTLHAADTVMAEQRRLAHVIDSTGVGIWDVDLVAREVHVSESWLRLAGFGADGPRTLPLREWRAHIHPDDRARVFATAEAGLASDAAMFQVDHRVWHEQGYWIWVASRGRVMERGADGTPLSLVGTHVDISARKLAEEELAEAARRDRLTGLANRAFFMERLEASLAQRRAGGAPPAVLFLDFDRFKIVNDAMGHQAGDELLTQIAVRLRAGLGAQGRADESRNLVARFGGDEFIVLLEDIAAAGDAEAVAARLLETLAQPYAIRGREVHSTASIGIVTPGDCAVDAGTIVRNADVAMYEAKRLGRARAVVFSPAMHAQLARKLQIETSLRKAIGTPQLSLVFQPIVELDTGRRASVEALLRWRHPVMGQVSPAEFVPVAEESGLIGAIGEWVMHEACAALARWRARDPRHAPHVVSVNVSRAELSQGERLLHTVHSALARSGLPPECLLLEVTEREVMRDPAASLALMHRLREIGVHLAMDDFGTGTSSLGCLRDYPFDVIKIDRSFVAGLAAGPDTLAVIHATITLVENLGKTSVAEGVETAEQLAILQSLGCHYAQGYHLGRPLAEEQIVAGDTAEPQLRTAIA